MAYRVVVLLDGERLERILENDLILKHDSIWPHGLNWCLHLDSLVELTEFRQSCLRHGWPPEYDTAAASTGAPELELDAVQRQCPRTTAAATRGAPELDLDAVRRQLAVSADQSVRVTNDQSSNNKKNARPVNTVDQPR